MRENYTVIADSGGGYPSRQVAEASSNELKGFGPDAEVVTIEGAASETYPHDGNWRWRRIDDARRPLASGPDRFMGRESARVGADTFSAIAADAPRLAVESYGVDLYEDAGQWRWQFIDEDREVNAASIGTYPTRSAVEDTIDALKGELPEASILEIDRTAFEFHEDVDGWRWRLIDDTGKEPLRVSWLTRAGRKHATR